MARHDPLRFFLITLFLATWSLLTSFRAIPVLISFHKVAVFYTFGDQITFHVTVKSEAPITEALLYVAVAGQSTRVIPVHPDANGEMRHELNVKSDPIRPFAEVRYWYEVRDTLGAEETSREFAFIYSDNRFAWSSRSDGSFDIFWNDPETRLEEDILVIARRSYESAMERFPVALTRPSQIFVYANEDDLRSTLPPGHNTWSAGHANPEDATIMIVLPQGSSQRSELERLLPHEMAHILLFTHSQENYKSLPAWLVEGIASSAELNPAPERGAVLLSAAETGALIPMQQLCAAFPEDDAAAYLAYAQAESFVQYLTRQYGAESLLELTHQSTPVRTCDDAFAATFSLSLDEAEADWQRQVLGVTPTVNDGGDWGAMAALLGLLVLAPLGPVLISTREE